MKSNLIAIAGYKGVGKDTSAEMLRYLLNTPKFLHYYWLFKILKNIAKNPYKKTSFAYPLKKTLATMLNIDVKRFEDRSFKENAYICLSDMYISWSPYEEDILSDNKFNKCLDRDDFRTIRESFITIRQLMQFWGTNVMRRCCGDKLWILLTLTNNEPTIVSDLRFRTEAEEVKKRNGILVYINRPGYEAGQHASEKEVSKLLENKEFNYIIENNGTLKDLFYKMKGISRVI